MSDQALGVLFDMFTKPSQTHRKGSEARYKGIYATIYYAHFVCLYKRWSRDHHHVRVVRMDRYIFVAYAALNEQMHLITLKGVSKEPECQQPVAAGGLRTR